MDYDYMNTSKADMGMRTKVYFSLVLLFYALSGYSQSKTSLVDPFHGVDNYGNAFPGAALPFSMVKPGPDVYNAVDWLNPNSGYMTGRPVCGFSQTHVSGTGGGAKYGHFRITPFVGDVNKRDLSSPVADEYATPGYYAGTLTESGIRCELTLTPSVGFHRYTAADTETLNVLVNASSLLDGGSYPQHLFDSGIEILSGSEVTGYCRSGGGWNQGAPYYVYFYLKFDREAIGFGTFRDGRLSRNNKKEISINLNDHTQKAAYLTFDTSHDKSVSLKIALSYISKEKAHQNYRKEAEGKTFSEVRKDAGKAWESVLSVLDVSSPFAGVDTLIYTGLYRSLIMPVDRTGEMPGWQNDVCYDDFYAIWDTFRTNFPLMNLFYPDYSSEIVNALVNIGEKEGFMPDARSGNANGLTQGGSNCDVVIADAFVKGIKGIDYERALKLMLRNADTEPEDPWRYGRGGTIQYDTLGYISNAVERSGTRQVEYAYNDYAISVVANGLGYDSLAKRYYKRSGYWKNLWNADAESFGVRGFIWPRQITGEWQADYNPLEEGIWDKVFYEGTSWQYSLYVPHDIPGLIRRCGGAGSFVRRLNLFFDKGLNGKRGFYDVANEPSFLTPCLYIAAGRHDLTAKRIRQITSEYYDTGRSGLPGNDDSGAMGTWYLFNALGLYPNAGQNYYFITSPLISKATLRLPGGRSLQIVVRNQSPGNIYVGKVELNGKPVQRAWLFHDEVTKGGILEFTMSRSPTSFGKKKEPFPTYFSFRHIPGRGDEKLKLELDL